MIIQVQISAMGALTLCLTTATVFAQSTQRPNGFDLTDAAIPISEIRHGGPPRDGIPAILSPRFESVADADSWLRPDDRVIGVHIGDEAVAYPQRITIWHEIVNDTVAEIPILVTYCPLCGTSMVFERTIGRRTFSFGVSGLLYQSDMLMYDHQTESLWSQLKMEAVAGPMAGATITLIPSEDTIWGDWRRQYPDSIVLSRDTGALRDYDARPYANYFDSPETMFPVPRYRNELPDKAWVYGIIVNGVPRAYPLNALSTDTTEDTVAGTTVKLEFAPGSERLNARRGDSGAAIPVVRSYWFAWQAFYPKTEIYRPD